MTPSVNELQCWGEAGGGTWMEACRQESTKHQKHKAGGAGNSGTSALLQVYLGHG